jgi:hypothetical protein
VFCQILLFLCVSFDTPYDTASNSTCQLSDHGILCKALFVSWQKLFIIFFILSFCISRMSRFKPSVLYSDISVNWRYQHHWFINVSIIIILLLLLFWFYFRVNRYTNSAWLLSMLLVFEFFVTSESALCFPSLVATLRLLESFRL